jgi:antitoxin ParD1/3/4
MTMNVNLSPQLEAMVKAKVASGRYTSASEVVREALRLMEQQDQLRALQLQQLRRDIQDGLASGEAEADGLAPRSADSPLSSRMEKIDWAAARPRCRTAEIWVSLRRGANIMLAAVMKAMNSPGVSSPLAAILEAA